MSSITPVLRRGYPVKLFRRHSSTKPQRRKPRHALSDEKMRALISLYHQSGDFITPENLSQRIDEAFIREQKDTSGGIFTQPTVDDLRDALTKQRRAAKVAEWESTDNMLWDGRASMWSVAKSERERKVAEALFGVEIRQQRTLPGLETLTEAVATKTLPTPATQEEIEEMLKEEEGSDTEAFKKLLQQQSSQNEEKR